MSKHSVIVWTFLSMLLFQNFDLKVPRFELFVQKVDEVNRKDHAKELLGKGFRGSLADKMKSKKSLNMAIYDQFKKRLPKADRWQAAPLANLVIEESSKFELDPIFVMAIVAQESSFRPKALGPVGEIGLMQLRPKTAAWIAGLYGIPFYGAKTLEQPYVNLKIGIAYVSRLRENFKGQPGQYVSAYNMGPTSVRRMVANQKTPREYSGKIMQRYQDLYAAMSTKSKPLITAKR